MDIDGISAVVTGGASGLGLATARRLVASGASVVIADLPASEGEEVALELGDRARFVAADVTNEEQMLAPAGEALRVALELASEVAANAPLAVKASKRVVRESSVWAEDELFARQAPLIEVVRNSEDATEGARAFVEKRAPAWQGR
jgi:NAD(P)-dependent dehydrogenase (short-subunit alcohol dehydrogenase family)